MTQAGAREAGADPACPVCRLPVETSSADGSPAVYCGPRCRRRAARRRHRRRRRREQALERARQEEYLRRALAPGPLCPQPYKRSFATAELAWAWIGQSHRGDDGIAPYECVCGAVHVGH